MKVRLGQLTCTTHVAYQRVSSTAGIRSVHTSGTLPLTGGCGVVFLQRDVKDIFTPIQFEVSYSLRDTNTHRPTSKAFPPLKPILQQTAGQQNTITNQVLTLADVTDTLVLTINQVQASYMLGYCD